MNYSAQTTLRHTGWLLLQYLLILVGSLIFIMSVPRILGTSSYGRYALITSIMSWFVMFGSLGIKPVITRFVPEWIHQKDTESLKRFIDGSFSLFTFVGLISCLGYLLITSIWLKDLDPWLFVLLGASVMIRSISSLLFLIFLGLNRASRWGAGELLRRWLSLPLIIIGFLLWGLKGSCAGIFLTEVVLLVISLIWIAKTITLPGFHFRWDWMKPYIRFGLVFYGGTLLAAAFWFSGESMIKMISGNYVQIAYFGLARNIYLTLALMVSQIAMAFTPVMVQLRIKKNHHEFEKWLGLLMKSLTAGGILVVYGVVYLGDHLFSIILGSEYSILAQNFLPLAFALLIFIPSSMALMVAISNDRPDIHLKSAGVQLLAFWVIGPILVSKMASLGGTISYLCALVIQLIFLLAILKNTIRFPLMTWMVQLGVGGLLLFPALLSSNLIVRGSLFLVSSGCFLSAMLLLRMVSISEHKKLLTLFFKQKGPIDSTIVKGPDLIPR